MNHLIRDSMRSQGTPHDMSQPDELVHTQLESLPFDILRIIVWSERLSQDDAAALRLTCRALVDVAATRLFYRIVISKLNVDRDIFLSICHSPHLAAHVHEVEWHEVSWDVELFSRLSAHASSAEAQDADAESLCRYFQSQAEAAFWLRNVPVRSPDAADIDSERQKAVAEFKDDFQAALDLLPNLHTFVSRPMSSTRAINGLDSKYPLTADYLPRLQEALEGPEIEPQRNDGLFLFFIPAMGRPTSTITRLRWADEFPGLSYMRHLPASAFERLESLELCFNPDLGTSLSIDHLKDGLSGAAPTLRHLKLCLEHGYPYGSPGPLEQLILGPELASSSLCSLQSLSLVSVRLTSAALLDIVKSNARSLRHLRLDTIPVTGYLVQQLAELPELKLSTMEIIEEVDNLNLALCARALVRFINGEKPNHCRHSSEDFEYDSEYYSCDAAVRNWVEKKPDYRHATTPKFEYESPSDTASIAASSSSENSVDRRRKGPRPRWSWGRFFNKHGCGEVYYYQVGESHPHGHYTSTWKFTSRDGVVYYGYDPLIQFDDWDPDAGDVEEPTPYCQELREFYRDGNDAEYHMGSLASYLGVGSINWELIKNQAPPEGAIRYDGEPD